MKLLILRFNDDAIYEDIQKISAITDHISREDIAILTLLSICHRHCIVALTGEACAKYENTSVTARNQIDDVVEKHVICGSYNYWMDLIRHLGSASTISKINFRRLDKFEVYCE